MDVPSPASLPSPPLCINDALSHHLLVEVFARIPYRDAFRCKSVCKLWLSCLHDDPSFVKRFIQQRIRERRQPVVVHHVPCNYREMLLAVGGGGVSPRLSLNFLPFLAGRREAPRSDATGSCRRLIVGSCNGLLLCSTASHESYYICNPITERWLALPAPPRRGGNVYVQVGFICDPFYGLHDDGDDEDELVSLNDRFGVKVVRLLPFALDREEGSAFEVGVEIFSSHTGCWTTSSTVMLPKRPRFDQLNPQIAVPRGGRLHWLLEPCDVLVYDPDNDELLLESYGRPTDALFSFSYWNRQWVAFQGLSLCQGSLWVGHIARDRQRLRVFMLANGVWCLKHDVDILRDMRCRSSSSTRRVDLYRGGIDFRTMHPSDPMVAYLSVGRAILVCDFGEMTIEVAAELENSGWDNPLLVSWFNVLTFPLPLWPTPLPLLFSRKSRL